MGTLALSPCPLPPSHLRNGAHSLSLLNTRSSCFGAVKCSALSTPSSADQSVKFKESAKNGNLIPLHESIFADHLTPVLAYKCLVKEDDRDAPSFLFECVDPSSKASSVGRYSVIGAQPTMEIVAKENVVTIMDHRKGQRT